jgi:hypothetical protein
MERALTLEPERPEFETCLYSLLVSYQADLSQFLGSKTETQMPIVLHLQRETLILFQKPAINLLLHAACSTWPES